MLDRVEYLKTLVNSASLNIKILCVLMKFYYLCRLVVCGTFCVLRYWFMGYLVGFMGTQYLISIARAFRNKLQKVSTIFRFFYEEISAVGYLKGMFIFTPMDLSLCKTKRSSQCHPKAAHINRCVKGGINIFTACLPGHSE